MGLTNHGSPPKLILACNRVGMGDLFASLILSLVTKACPVSSNTFEEPVSVAERE